MTDSRRICTENTGGLFNSTLTLAQTSKQAWGKSRKWPKPLYTDKWFNLVEWIELKARWKVNLNYAPNLTQLKSAKGDLAASLIERKTCITCIAQMHEAPKPHWVTLSKPGFDPPFILVRNSIAPALNRISLKWEEELSHREWLGSYSKALICFLEAENKPVECEGWRWTTHPRPLILVLPPVFHIQALSALQELNALEANVVEVEDACMKAGWGEALKALEAYVVEEEDACWKARWGEAAGMDLVHLALLTFIGVPSSLASISMQCMNERARCFSPLFSYSIEWSKWGEGEQQMAFGFECGMRFHKRAQ